MSYSFKIMKIFTRQCENHDVVMLSVHSSLNLRSCLSSYNVPESRKFIEAYISLFNRLLEVISFKIYSIQKEDTLLDAINMSGSTKTYRIEEVPKDEVTLRDNETLIPVAHFHKVYCIFFMISLYAV